MLTKYKSNLLAEHKWMHKIIPQQQMEKRATLIVHIVFTKYESNLLAEHKWMHEFTQQQVEKTAIIHC